MLDLPGYREKLRHQSNSSIKDSSKAVTLLRGDTIQLIIYEADMPPLLQVPQGLCLSTPLHRRILSTYFYGETGITLGYRLGRQNDLPPLLVESQEPTETKALYKKREFAAFLWKKILSRIALGLQNRPFHSGQRDEWIFEQLLAGINHIQHSLHYIESKLQICKPSEN